MKRLPIIAVSMISAMILLISSLPGSALAVSADTFKADLEKAGYTVTVAASPKHETLSIEGKLFTIEKDGKSAKVEVLDYGGNAALKADWNAENGKAPTPKKATTDFAGMMVLWNNDSVAIFDLRSPNDVAIARAAQSIYLGPGGVGGAEPAPGAPNTGNAGPAAASGDGFAPALQTGILVILFIAAAGGLAISIRNAVRARG